MLQTIRDKAQGFFAWVIVILITIPFAFWGINSYFGGGGTALVATVAGEEITQGDLNRAYQEERDRISAMLGGRPLPAFLDEKTLRRQALDRLVKEHVIRNFAEDNGFNVSNAQVRAYIAGIDAFKSGGQFDNERYETALRNRGMHPAEFEYRVRDSLVNEQVVLGISDTGFSTATERKQARDLRDQERELSWFRVTADSFRKDVRVTEDDIKASYEATKENYVEPQKVTVSYLELSNESLSANVPEPGEAAIEQRYQESKAEFTQPEERRASHILIAVKASDDEAAHTKAHEKAAEIKERLRLGEDFATLAKAESQDPGSASSGGELGWFGRGAMVPAFEQAVFDMQAGQISDVVESSFGFHIIKLEEIRPENVKPLDEVRPQLVRRLKTEEAERQFYDMSERLANLSYEQPDNLQVPAEELGLEIKKAGPFPQSGGDGIAAEPKVIAATFSDDVLKEGNNSEMIELGPNRLIVLRVSDIQPERIKPLAEVRDQIEDVIIAERAGEKAENAAKQAIAGGGDAQSMADAAGVELEQPGFVKRNNATLPGEVVEKLFQLPKPEEGKPKVEGVALANGDFAVLVYSGLRSPEGDANGPNVGLTQNRSETELNGFLADLEAKTKITIKEAEI